MVSFGSFKLVHTFDNQSLTKIKVRNIHDRYRLKDRKQRDQKASSDYRCEDHIEGGLDCKITKSIQIVCWRLIGGKHRCRLNWILRKEGEAITHNSAEMEGMENCDQQRRKKEKSLE